MQNTAIYYCRNKNTCLKGVIQLDKQQQLFDRLDKNLSDYQKEISGLEKPQIIGMAGEIAAMTDTHYYLQNSHEFEPEQIDYLLKFENPLDVVCAKWRQRTEDLSDMSFALNEVFDKQDALWDYPLHIETANNGTYLQKFEDVDVLKTLKAIADQKIVHYPNDIKTDMERIPKFIATGNPEMKMLLWHVSDYGTHIIPERDTFIDDTGANSTWTNYLRPGMLSYAVEISGMEAGIVKGNVYELDHLAHVAHVNETSLPFNLVTISYEDMHDVVVSRKEFDVDRHKLMSESGNVKNLRFHPENANEIATILEHEQNQREQTPVGNFKDHIKSLVDSRVKGEADRVCGEMQGLTEPNSPNKTHFMVKLSDEFMRLASSKDQSCLFDALPYKTKTLTNIKGEKGIFLTVTKDEIQKPSVRKQLAAAAKEAAKQQKTAPDKSAKKDREVL